MSEDIPPAEYFGPQADRPVGDEPHLEDNPGEEQDISTIQRDEEGSPDLTMQTDIPTAGDIARYLSALSLQMTNAEVNNAGFAQVLARLNDRITAQEQQMRQPAQPHAANVPAPPQQIPVPAQRAPIPQGNAPNPPGGGGGGGQGIGGAFAQHRPNRPPRNPDPPRDLAIPHLGPAAAPTRDHGEPPNTRDLSNVLLYALNLHDLNHPLHLWLGQNGISDMAQLLAVDPRTFNTSPQITDPNGNVIPMPLGTLTMVRSLLAFNRANFLHNGGYAVDWLHVTQPMLTYFQSNLYILGHPYSMIPNANVPGVPPNIPMVGNPNQPFQRQHPNEKLLDGVKKTSSKGGLTDYPDFTTDNMFVKWSEETRVVANLQDMGDVLELNPPYSPDPAIPFAQELFNQRSLYMYTVFSRHIKTSQGITIVRAHAQRCNGQAVWQALHARYINSQSAQLVVSKLRTEISSARLSPAYPGKYEHFVDKFARMIADHQEITPFHENYSEETKISLLHTALSSAPELMTVRTTLTINARHGIQCNFEEIVAMYKDLCAGPDSMRGNNGATRTVNSHYVYSYGDDNDHDMSDRENDKYTINAAARTPRKSNRQPASSSTSTPEASSSTDLVSVTPTRATAKRQPPSGKARPAKKPRLTRDIWFGMTLEEQKAWDVLSDTTKTKIIRYGMDMAAVMTRAINFVRYEDEDSCDEEGFEADEIPNSLLVYKSDRQPDSAPSSGQLMKFLGSTSA